MPFGKAVGGFGQVAQASHCFFVYNYAVSLSKWFILLRASLFAAVLLAACQPIPIPVQYNAAWQTADLRVFEAPNLSDPSYDLVAAYARLTATDLELRFDLLGSPDPFDYDLYVIIETGQGGNGHLPLNPQPDIDWDIALGFPAQGLPRAFDVNGSALQIRPRIQRDSVLDAATVRLSRKELSGDPMRYKVYAFIAKAGENQVADRIGPLLAAGPAQEIQAPLSLAFWDAFPAATPAQALRRWSGAHTGPYGQRHGLSILLQAAAQSSIPIAILDIKRPEQLSALEAVGGMTTIRQLQQDNLLLLPDLAYGDPQVSQASLQMSRTAGQRFSLSSSPFLYSTTQGTSTDVQDFYKTTRAAFTLLQDDRHVLKWHNIRLVPIQGLTTLDDVQVDEEGLTLATRAALINAALSPDPANLVVLGGDLPNSPWGDSLIAGPAFRYIAGHPWIHAMDADDLLHFPTIDGVPECPDLLCLPAQETAYPPQTQIRQSLQSAPAGLFRSLAWQTYLSLTEPTTDPRLRALRAGYLGQVGPLLAAARWNAAPADQASCTEDVNWDGTAECILSSQNSFLLLDPMGGRLVFAAARIGNEPFEIIGPRSQFVVGLGDALEWRPELGLAGDPQEIPGAFADSSKIWQRYQTETKPGEIILTNSLNGTRKIFHLTEEGFLVSIESQQTGLTHIPLALIDRQSFEPGGFSRYRLNQASLSSESQINAWELESGIGLQITTKGAEGTIHSFADSRRLLKDPEDPNTGYPPGHFIPFPLAVIELQSQGNYSVEIRLGKH